MPIYEYECRKCGVFEHRQSISEDPLKRCPTCRSGVQKLLSASAFHLKGGGWYADGYDKKKDGSAKTAASSDGAADQATASKPSSEISSKKDAAGKSTKSTKSSKKGGGSSKPAGTGS